MLSLSPSNHLSRRLHIIIQIDYQSQNYEFHIPSFRYDRENSNNNNKIAKKNNSIDSMENSHRKITFPFASVEVRDFVFFLFHAIELE